VSAKPEVELFYPMLPWKIAVTPNIFKTVTATPMESAEVEYETSPALSIDGMTLDLG